MKKNLTLLFWCFYLMACKQESEMSSFKNRIKILKSFTLSLDSLTPNQLPTPQFIQNKSLAFLNSKNNSIDIYGIEEKKIIKRIKLLSSGENAVGKIQQFLYHNTDSIFVVNSYQYKAFLIDENGKIKEKYSLIKQNKHSPTTAMPEVFPFHCPPVLIGKRLHIASAPDDNPYFDSFYQREALSIVLNLENKEIQYKMRFSDLYQQKYFTNNLNFYSRIYLKNDNKFVYGFFADQNLQITNAEYNLLKNIKLNSPHFIDIPSLKKRVESSQENTKIGNTNPTYFNIYHNHHKNEFYRIISIPISNKTNKKTYFKGFLGIFDKDFENIGEVLLYETDKTNYNLMNLFFTPEGMWIQRSTDNEDELVYDLVEFVAE